MILILQVPRGRPPPAHAAPAAALSLRSHRRQQFNIKLHQDQQKKQPLPVKDAAKKKESIVKKEKKGDPLQPFQDEEEGIISTLTYNQRKGEERMKREEISALSALKRGGGKRKCARGVWCPGEGKGKGGSGMGLASRLGGRGGGK